LLSVGAADPDAPEPEESEEPDEQAARVRARGSATTANAVRAREGRRIEVLAGTERVRSACGGRGDRRDGQATNVSQVVHGRVKITAVIIVLFE
jgi:hypothetical protein